MQILVQELHTKKDSLAKKTRRRALDHQKTFNKNNQNNKYTLFSRKNSTNKNC